MNLGRFLIAVAVACALVVSMAGCGSDDSSSDASTDNTPTEATAPTGKAEKADDDVAKKPKSSSSSKSTASDSEFSGPPKVSGPYDPVPKQLSKSQERQVKRAFNSMISGIDKRKVSYLCGEAYSKAFLKLQEENGGCVAYTTKQVKTFSSYDATVVAVARIGQNLVQVQTVLEPNGKKANRENPATLYFTFEDGKWKRAVPPAASQQGTPIG